jgi:hypothetical protein
MVTSLNSYWNDIGTAVGSFQIAGSLLFPPEAVVADLISFGAGLSPGRVLPTASSGTLDVAVGG